MNIGKSVRLERIFNRNTGRSIIVPLDHGTTVGPIAGLVDLRETVNKVAEGGANAVLMHKGLPRCAHRGHGRDVGLIIHLSASTTLSPFPNAKILVSSVEDGIKLGADAVSVHLNLGDESERDMLRDMGEVASKCNEWGMPLLAMIYARGPKVKSEWDPATVAHCARLGEELGADVIKVVYTGDVDSFSRVTEGCCVPVVIAGGAGLSMGRNIFQADDPTRLVQALHAVVHMDYSVDQALALLEEPKI